MDTMSIDDGTPIERRGTFLFQLEPEEHRAHRQPGRGNIWSGRIDANNGYSQELAEAMAKRFAAVNDMIPVLKLCREMIQDGEGPLSPEELVAKIDEVLEKAGVK